MQHIVEMLRGKVQRFNNLHQLHIHTGISYPTLAQFKKGEKSISRECIERLLDFFDMEVQVVQRKAVKV